MAKKQTVVAELKLTAEQRTAVTTLAADRFSDHLKGRDRWLPIIAACTLAGIVQKDLKSESAGLYRTEWIARARVKFGREMTVAEIDAAKRTANADFSRGFRDHDPNVKPKVVKGAQTAPGKSTETPQSDATTGAAGPMMVDMLQRLKTRHGSIQAGLLMFQTSLGELTKPVAGKKERLPASVKEWLTKYAGDAAENVAKLGEEIDAATALLK